MTLPPPPTDSLFRWIETQEAAIHSANGSSTCSAWGRVLDAGTGRHSLRWLTRLAPQITQIVAVTGEKPLAEELTTEFGTRDGAPPLQVHAGNWLDPHFLDDEAPFDVIVADYLVGSIEGFAPFFQDEIFDRLKPLLAPNGRMYVVGLEPLTETKSVSPSTEIPQAQCTARCCAPPTDADAALVQDMARMRDACILLAGRRCYREFPLLWIQRQLEKSGLRVGENVQLANVYTVDTIGRQLKVARNQLKWFQDEALASAMETTLQHFESRVKDSLQGGKRKIRFGFDYVVAARNSGAQ